MGLSIILWLIYGKYRCQLDNNNDTFVSRSILTSEAPFVSRSILTEIHFTSAYKLRYLCTDLYNSLSGCFINIVASTVVKQCKTEFRRRLNSNKKRNRPAQQRASGSSSRRDKGGCVPFVKYRARVQFGLFLPESYLLHTIVLFRTN